MKSSTRSTERVHFRLFMMPCCGHQLCWVNPRLPSFCPECGKPAVMALREQGDATLVSDRDAMLITHTKGIDFHV